MFRRLTFAVVLWFAGLGSALAQYVTPVQMRDANLTTTNVQNYITTLSTFTLPRTLTIPSRSSLNAYYIQFTDTANAVNGSNTLTIQVADGSLINGQSTLVLSVTGTYVFLAPSASGYAASIVYPSSGAGNPAGGAVGQIQWNSAGALAGFTASGDATINTSTGALTLTAVNTNIGTWGGAAFCSAFTTNAKGLITAAAQSACTPAIANVTGLGTGIAAALAINTGSAGAPVLFNGAGGTPTSLVGTNITGTAAGLTAGTANAVAVGNITGAGAGCITWLTTPSSANLRGCISDETGTGLAYFQGGALGTPISGTATNLTGLPTTALTGTLQAAQEPAHTGDMTNAAGSLATTVVGINGVNQTTAWSAYSPTCVFSTPGTSVIGTIIGRFKQIGKTTFFSADCTVTTVGTGTGNLVISLPAANTLHTIVGASGKEVVTTGKLLAIQGTGSTTVNVTNFDNTSIATDGNGSRVQLLGTYEAD